MLPVATKDKRNRYVKVAVLLCRFFLVPFFFFPSGVERLPSTSSLIEPNDGRRLLDRDPSGVSQEIGDESRECRGSPQVVEQRGKVGLRGEGEVTEAMVKERERALYKGPRHTRLKWEKYLGVEWEHKRDFSNTKKLKRAQIIKRVASPDSLKAFLPFGQSKKVKWEKS